MIKAESKHARQLIKQMTEAEPKMAKSFIEWTSYLKFAEGRKANLIKQQNTLHHNTKSLVILGFKDDGMVKMDMNMVRNDINKDQKQIAMEGKQEQNSKDIFDEMEFKGDAEKADEKQEEEEKPTKGKTINEFLLTNYKNIDGEPIFKYVYEPVNGIHQVLVDRTNEVEAKLLRNVVTHELVEYMSYETGKLAIEDYDNSSNI
jgi:hypothetical protein